MFPTFENYTDQFRIFTDSMIHGGSMVYNEEDPIVKEVVESSENHIKKYPYQTPIHFIDDGITYLETCFKPFFLNKLSLILSKIITFASTDIPMVKIIPAIPGKVNTALKEAKIPKMNKMFTAKAISAYKPAFP